jgi:trehalose synthase
MPVLIREVHVQHTIHLEDYAGVDHLEPLVEDVRHLGAEVAHLLGTHQVWMLSSTATGGGVAEILPSMCSLLGDLDISARWLVLEPSNPRFFGVTKALHNLLHGAPAEFDPARARAIYDDVSEQAAAQLRHVAPDDGLIVHDPQPAGIGRFVLPALRPRLIWRCHIGIPETTPETELAWSFLRPYLEPFAALVFSAAQYIPSDLLDKSTVVSPGIDPLSFKNRELRPYKLLGILRSAGLLTDPDPPAWTRFEAPVERWVDGSWAARPLDSLLTTPILLQISRFDRLKGFRELMNGFVELLRFYPERAAHLRIDTARALSELGRVQLVLAGPSPAGVSDDPEAREVLAELLDHHATLPADARARIHLLRLPMVNVKQNALIVNALQRIASVAVQNSLHEGFGLTVSEAMWKGVPMVGSNVGGIAMQVRHGRDGWLIEDPRDPAAVAEALLAPLAHPRVTERMTRSARVRVREHFLVLTQLRAWLHRFRNDVTPRVPAAAQLPSLR